MKLSLKLPEGSRVPWYYGHAYYDFLHGLETYYIIPLNWLFKWSYRLASYYHRLRFHRDWIDKYQWVMYYKIKYEYEEKVIKKLTYLKTIIQNHYKEFEVVDGISLYKSDILDEMIAKEKAEVKDIDDCIEWMKKEHNKRSFRFLFKRQKKENGNGKTTC